LLNQTLKETQDKNIKIEIFGLGYVGLPLAIRLGVSGWKVRGIDINQDRIKRLQNKELFESERYLKTEFEESVKNNNLIFSEKPEKNNRQKIGIICVPTPIPTENSKSNIYVVSAVKNFLESCKKGDIIIIESSIEVGTTDEIKRLIESNGFTVGQDFGLAFCPERIDPQNKKWNLENIPRVIYCSDELTFKISKYVYQNVNNSQLIRVSSSLVAEVVKSFENAFRLVNISLINELAILCDNLGIDVSEVVKAASTKPFGFLPFYSGAGAGGHCIPKDPKFLLESSKKFGVEYSTISNALKINEFVPKYITFSIENEILKLNLPKSVLICGMSYKPDIEDMRDSPAFKILKEFNIKGYDITIFDPAFKIDLLEKYLLENNLKEKNFAILNNLDDDDIIKNFSCLCIVQHHSKTKFRINEIYEKSLNPIIYDCQNKLSYNPSSKTILKSFGNNLS
jgi:UDP-N-acetyl-D-glucosamine dehydrogenase